MSTAPRPDVNIVIRYANKAGAVRSTVLAPLNFVDDTVIEVPAAILRGRMR